MAKVYDAIDFDFTWDGDFQVEGGDIKSTEEDLLQSLRTEILTVLKSELSEWREDPSVGANLSEFIGEPNIPEIAKLIEGRIRASLSSIIESQDLFVRIVPVGPHKILINMQVEILPTVNNRLVSGDIVSINLLFDYMERGVFATIEDLSKFGGREI